MIEQAGAVLAQIALVLFLSPLDHRFQPDPESAAADAPRTWHPAALSRSSQAARRREWCIPDTASWIFRATPYVLFSTTLLAGLLIPTISAQAPLSRFGGVLAVVYLLALGRFFLALGRVGHRQFRSAAWAAAGR